MSIPEKATEYMKIKKDDNQTPSWLDVREAYIQGSKDMYIEKEHEKVYNVDEYLPPKASEYRTVEVADIDTNQMVYYGYFEKEWFTTVDGCRVATVQRWKFGEPEKIEREEPEKTAHQLSEELKQLQYEKLEMEKQFSKVIGTFEELLKNQFVMCELRDFWRKRAGLVQKCEE